MKPGDQPAAGSEAPQPYNFSLPESKGGIMLLLREWIAARVAAQLDPAVRKYGSSEFVKEGCKLLADKVKEAGYTLDIIIGWHDPEWTYRGSEL